MTVVPFQIQSGPLIQESTARFLVVSATAAGRALACLLAEKFQQAVILADPDLQRVHILRNRHFLISLDSYSAAYRKLAICEAVSENFRSLKSVEWVFVVDELPSSVRFEDLPSKDQCRWIFVNSPRMQRSEILKSLPAVRRVELSLSWSVEERRLGVLFLQPLREIAMISSSTPEVRAEVKSLCDLMGFHVKTGTKKARPVKWQPWAAAFG